MDLSVRFYMKVIQRSRVLEASVMNNNVVRLRMTKRKPDGSGKCIGCRM